MSIGECPPSISVSPITHDILLRQWESVAVGGLQTLASPYRPFISYPHTVGLMRWNLLCDQP